MSFNNIYKGKKVLLTGHTGFKGSWMAIWLRELGAEVFGYSLAPNSSMDNFLVCGLQEKIHHRVGDVRDLDSLQRYFDDVLPDIAFHLAAQPLVLLSYQQPQQTFETNLMGVVNFFEAVRNSPSVRVAVNVTSDKCYDNNEWVWGYRENDPMGGKDPYSASKGAAELITSSYINSYFTTENTCHVASARAGNVIGGGDWAEDRIVPDYFRALSVNKELFLRNPHATRPWQHVLEPLSGYLNLGAALYIKGKQISGGWNFGPKDSSNYSVVDLIEKIQQLVPRGKYTTPRCHVKPHEARFLKLDISKAVNNLEWSPVLSFDQTVEFTVEGYAAQGSMDVYSHRVAQIAKYTAEAKEKLVQWAM